MPMGANSRTCCAVIEKGFQGGGDRLRAMNVNYHALAVIDRADETGIYFREDA